MFSTIKFLTSFYRISRLSRAKPEKVARLQEHRLRKLLRHAVANSPLYADKYRGIDIERCSLTDLPSLTKQEGMGRFEDWVTDRDLRLDDVETFIENPDNTGKYFRDKYVLLHTSGSQGQPTIVVQSRDNIELTFMLQATRGNTTGQTNASEIVHRLLSPARLAVVTMKRGFYPTAVNFDFFPKPLRPLVNLKRWSQDDPQLLAELEHFSPTVISGYTNVLLSLAEAADSGRLHLPHLQHLVNYSEELTLPARKFMMDTFHVPIMNMYATGECGHLTSGCPTDVGCHVNSDWAILEVVDAEGNPVEPGTRGEKVFVTNLANMVQPLIRYEVTDRVTMATEPCRCGSRLPRIERIDGRKTDSLWIQRDGKWERMEPFVFKNSLDYCTEVLEWQAYQDDPRNITLSLVLVPGKELNMGRMKAMVQEQLQLYHLQDLVTIHYRVVPHLKPDARSAKVKRIICKVGPETQKAVAA